jgi:hypothetical protein
MLASNKMILAHSERVVSSWLDIHMEVANSLVGPNFKTSLKEGLYITRTLIPA